MMAPGGNEMKGADLRGAGRGSIRSISLTAPFFAGVPLEAAGWIALAIYLALVVGFAWNPTPFAQGLAALGVAIACTHAALFYGWRNALVLLAICLATTFTMENIGAATGFPFGHYHFEVGSNLIHVGAIPIIVGPLWFGMGYISWIVAGTLLGSTDRRLSGKIELVALPVVAAFVMTQWDVVMDPPRGDDFKSLDMA
jgi:uncharacterized membrane protein